MVMGRKKVGGFCNGRNIVVSLLTPVHIDVLLNAYHAL